MPMDFTSPFSFQQLNDHGFGCKKTFFSLLGVSYYVTKEDIARLFKHLFAQVPSGSSIVFDYADEKLFEEKGMSDRVEHMVQMAAAGGEPMKSCYV
ncbi:class I SAM-dependent methyltransferase [Pseudomonas sp. ISL-88]|uniref:class I SAM-dependent methyltransferase n=1 Tax=Pseudomonas sp. ISL-88 TaxID=2819169 RepID=UPI003369C884